MLFKCCGNTCVWKSVMEIHIVIFKQRKLYLNNSTKRVHFVLILPKIPNSNEHSVLSLATPRCKNQSTPALSPFSCQALHSSVHNWIRCTTQLPHFLHNFFFFNSKFLLLFNIFLFNGWDWKLYFLIFNLNPSLLLH